MTFDAGYIFITEIGIHGVIVIRFNGYALDVFGMKRAEYVRDSGKGRANVNIFPFQIGPKGAGVLGMFDQVPIRIVPPTVPMGFVAIGSLTVKTFPGIGHLTVIIISIHERHKAIGFKVCFAGNKSRLLSDTIQGRQQYSH
ncbi:unnamed protein product [marine sediment metagenome]|uniref:Uncharacterized protein n=1 Tax=marine sediment metagenome TaxID=412755 RepID=X1SXY1_9ZZZZ